MGEPEFNPYHKWFGIPPTEQPPNHYRLLGIELYESDTDVIESAADQRLWHLQKYSTGEKSEIAQKLAREVSTARFCLLKPEIKVSYDESLGKSSGEESRPKNPDQSAQRPGPPPVPGSTRSMCSEPPKKPGAVPPKMPDAASPNNSGDKTSKQPSVPRNPIDSDSRATPTAPPVQNERSESVQERSLKTPIIVLALVVIILAGSVFALTQFGQKDDSDSSQVASNSVDSNDKANDKSSSDQSPPVKNSPAKSSDSDPEQNSTDVEKQKDDPQKNNKGSAPNKTDGDQNTNNGEVISNPSDTASKVDSKKTEPKKDDGKKKDDQAPAEKDKPLIIKTKDNSKKAAIVRAPLPLAERWKPFLTPLKREYDIKDSLPRDSRFVLFKELISDAADEPRPDKAYAQFNLAMDQARILNHASGVSIYSKRFSERFEFEFLKTKALYLKSIADSISSKPYIPQLLAEARKTIQTCEKSGRDLKSAVDILEAIVALADKPLGKYINKPYFEMWLLSERELQKAHRNIKLLFAKRKANQLTPEENRILGIYDLFIMDVDYGLDELKLGDDKQLRDLAILETEKDDGSADFYAALADAWWAISTKSSKYEYLFKMRAKHFYARYKDRVIGVDDMPQRVSKRIETLNYGIGLKRLPKIRAASKAIFLDRVRGFKDKDSLTPPTHLLMPNLGTICTNTKLDGLDQDNARIKIMEINGRKLFSPRRIIYDSGINEWAWLNTSPILYSGHLVQRINERNIDAVRIEELRQNPDPNSRKRIRLSIREIINDFDINANGDTYVLGQQYYFYWPAQTIPWKIDSKNNHRPTPQRFKSKVAFIPTRIRAVPNSKAVALANTRFLSIVNKSSIDKIHTVEELFDFDFASDGKSIALALKNGVRYRPIKGGRPITLPSPKANKVKFLPNSRFVVSLHDDHSLRVWDVRSKDNNYLIDRFELPDFRPTTFVVAPDGSSIGMVDQTSRYLFLDVHYE